MQAKAYGDLVDLRVARTEALDERRARMDAPLDRFTTSFWQKTMGHRAWRRLDPSLWDWELAMGPVVDQLKPDLIHANDFRMLGVGARAKLRARGEGRRTALVWDSHDYLPGINPWNSHPRWHKAMIAHEREYAPYADAVTTVSETMCELLTAGHGLTTTPVIVRNAPTVGLDPDDPGPGVRELCGLDADVPLLLYVGVMTPARGIDTMVQALPRQPGVHVGFVARESAHLDRILDVAKELGVADRVHHLPYVEVDRICSYIASADVGVFPGLHLPNHEVDLPTKIYEYAHARLPMVVSDLKTTGETVNRLGIGEVFVAEDVDDYIRAVRRVLDDPDTLPEGVRRGTARAVRVDVGEAGRRPRRRLHLGHRPLTRPSLGGADLPAAATPSSAAVNAARLLAVEGRPEHPVQPAVSVAVQRRDLPGRRAPWYHGPPDDPPVMSQAMETVSSPS